VRELHFPGGRAHFERREVTLDGAEAKLLTEREAELLVYLARNPSRAIEREELLRAVWSLDPRGLDTRTVDMAVVRLRDKLGAHGGDVVRTVRGKGYMLGEIAQVLR
jgi:DNA-binding response OmpR family regulator